MTNEELLKAMLALLSNTRENENGNSNDDKVEMLTIKECV